MSKSVPQCIVIVQFDLPDVPADQVVARSLPNTVTYRNLGAKGLIRKDYIYGADGVGGVYFVGEPQSGGGLVYRGPHGRSYQAVRCAPQAHVVRHAHHRRQREGGNAGRRRACDSAGDLISGPTFSGLRAQQPLRLVEMAGAAA